jgi:hypothetical protein
VDHNERNNGISSSKEAGGTKQEEDDRIVDPRVKRQKRSQDDEAQSAEGRRGVACTLVAIHIHLASIRPQDLRWKVDPSGLVKAEALQAAYKAHAIRADIVSHVISKTHSRPVWNISDSHLLTGKPEEVDFRTGHVLNSDHVKSGVHIWSIEVVKSTPSLQMGVTRFRRGESVWFLYSRNGRSHQWGDCIPAIPKPDERRSVFPKFCTGSVITFRLDLRESGTLSAQVDKDSSNEFVLFENILMEGEERVDMAFAPTVLIEAPGAINFLGFEKA